LIKCVGDPVFCAPNIGGGGHLGAQYSPLFVGSATNHPAITGFKPPDELLPAGEPERLPGRRRLLDSPNATRTDGAAAGGARGGWRGSGGICGGGPWSWPTAGARRSSWTGSRRRCATVTAGTPWDKTCCWRGDWLKRESGSSLSTAGRDLPRTRAADRPARA